MNITENTIHTNLIQSVSIDREQLRSRFDLYVFTRKNASQEWDSSEAYKTVYKKISQAFPQGYVLYADNPWDMPPTPEGKLEKRFCLLMPRLPEFKPPRLDDVDFIADAWDGLSDGYIAMLLVRALPAVKARHGAGSTVHRAISTVFADGPRYKAKENRLNGQAETNSELLHRYEEYITIAPQVRLNRFFNSKEARRKEVYQWCIHLPVETLTYLGAIKNLSHLEKNRKNKYRRYVFNQIDGCIYLADNQDNPDALIIKNRWGTKNRVDAFNVTLNVPKNKKKQGNEGNAVIEAHKSHLNSKIGVLERLRNDLIDAYGAKSIEFNFETIEMERVAEKADLRKAVNKQYEEIKNCVTQQPLYLLDQSEDVAYEQGLAQMVAEIEALYAVKVKRINATQVDTLPHEGAYVLQFHYPQSYYEQNEWVDPYEQLRQKRPHLVIQSFTTDLLKQAESASKKKKNKEEKEEKIFDVYLSCLFKELVIKEGVLRGDPMLSAMRDQLINQIPDGTYFIYQHVWREKSGQNKGINRRYFFAKTDRATESLIFGELSDEEFEDMLIYDVCVSNQKEYEAHLYSDTNMAWHPHIIYVPQQEGEYSPEVYLINDTEAQMMPDPKGVNETLDAINQSLNACIDRSVIENYIDSYSQVGKNKQQAFCFGEEWESQPVQAQKAASAAKEKEEKKRTPPLEERLIELLGAYTNQDIPINAIHHLKLNTRSQEVKDFFAYLDQLGFKIAHAFRSYRRHQTHQDAYLSVCHGIMRNLNEGLYVASSVTPAEAKSDTFDRIYRVMTLSEQRDCAPAWFWSSLEGYFVRNKNTTVYPWVYKFVKEYVRKQVGSHYQDD